MLSLRLLSSTPAMSRDHSDLVVECLAPGHQRSLFASRSRTILPEEDHADELDPPSAARGSSP
jgi:hypothetical protein